MASFLASCNNLPLQLWLPCLSLAHLDFKHLQQDGKASAVWLQKQVVEFRCTVSTKQPLTTWIQSPRPTG